MATELGESVRSRVKVVAVTVAIILLLPIGVLLAAPAQALPSVVLTVLFSFGLIALLCLVMEELPVEAHEVPDRPWVRRCSLPAFWPCWCSRN